MDTHQAIYDAVRSRIGPANIEAAVEIAIRDANLSHHAEMIAHAWIGSAYEQQRPSVLYRPALSLDGSHWCALYGDNLQDGVAGFGKSPSEAMADFDRAWSTALAKEPQP